MNPRSCRACSGNRRRARNCQLGTATQAPFPPPVKCRDDTIAAAPRQLRMRTAEGTWRQAASARGSSGRRIYGSCSGAGAMSATSACPAWRKWRSCAARWPMRASAASPSRRARRLCVFRAADMDVKPIRALSAIPGFKASDYPPLATGKGALCRRAHRHVRRRLARVGRGSRAAGGGRARPAAGGDGRARGAPARVRRSSTKPGATTFS